MNTRKNSYLSSFFFVGIANVLFLNMLVAAQVLEVGPGKMFVLPSIAASFAQDGDTIEIDAQGFYDGDEVTWEANNLTIRGVNGRPEIKGIGQLKNGKGLWLVKGNNTVIENFEFSNAKARDKNGAGIRQEGTGLEVRFCYFHDNENGILAGKNLSSEIIIQNSEFSSNGHGKGQTHNIYIGEVKSFTLQYSFSHHAIIGHNVKTRALTNYILYNAIIDGHDGRSSYAIDFSEAGLSYVLGNVIQQGPETDNSTMLSFGAEGINNPKSELYIVNNTFVNDRHTGIFIKNYTDKKIFIANNVFAGKGSVGVKKSEMLNNILPDEDPLFVNRKNYVYLLKRKSPAVDKAQDLTPFDLPYKLLPEFEYVHKASSKKRIVKNTLDIGAYEYQGD